MEEASVSIRLNPFKGLAGPEGTPVPWSPYGRILSDRPVFTLDPLTPPLASPGNMPKYMQDMLDNGYDVLTVPTGEYITTSMFNERTSNPLANIYTSTDGASENYNLNGTFYANLTPFKGFTYTSKQMTIQRKLSSWKPLL